MIENIVYIEFFNKKHFPKGKWLSEPDFCKWYNKSDCLAIRDMSLGTWKGFVGVDNNHPYFNCSLNSILAQENFIELLLSIHGGIDFAGLLPHKYREFNNKWWIGFSTSHTTDIMPLLEEINKLSNKQSYKDFSFVRKQVNYLSNHLSKIK
jgi:hypothetical protein